MVAAAVHAGRLGDNHSVGIIGCRAKRDQAIHPLMRLDTCGWTARQGSVAAAITPRHPACIGWLACRRS